MRYNGFIGPSYTLDSRCIDAQRCVNWYLKLNETGKGKSGEAAALIATPGLLAIASLGGGPIRGQYVGSNGVLYAVSGDKLYSLDETWEATELGELLTSSGVVDFADNGTTLVLVDGDNGYWHTFSSFAVTAIDSEGWRGSTRVNYIDGYFLFNEPETGIFYISNLSSTDIDVLDFSSADGAPDNIIATLVNHREVWLFGRDSIEAWYNSGDATFPFARSGFIEIGCAAAFSVAKIGRSTLWLGRDQDGQGIVYAAQGLNPQRISTHAVELQIQSYGDISDAVAWTYQENGHFFYVLNFTSANTTWVYDLTTRSWHERAYLSNGSFARHRANSHALAYGFHIVGDYENGNLYKLSSSIATDNGQEIRRMRTAPHISNSNKRIKYSSFELEAESGVGISSDLDREPQAVLQFSEDGGNTWSNEKWTGLGKTGQRTKRVIWRRLGASRSRVFRVIISDAAKTNLIGAELSLEGLSN